MTEVTAFTADQQAAIETLRTDLSNRIGAEALTEYGATDCGQHWAALCVESLPEGSFGLPGALVSILTGNGIPGFAATATAGGAALGHAETTKDLGDLLRGALEEGAREYGALTQGAMAVH